MILTNENYLEKAEQVINNLRKNEKGLILLTTTKLRKILSMVSEIYSDASRIRLRDEKQIAVSKTSHSV